MASASDLTGPNLTNVHFHLEFDQLLDSSTGVSEVVRRHATDFPATTFVIRGAVNFSLSDSFSPLVYLLIVVSKAWLAVKLSFAKMLFASSNFLICYAIAHLSVITKYFHRQVNTAHIL